MFETLLIHKWKIFFSVLLLTFLSTTIYLMKPPSTVTQLMMIGSLNPETGLPDKKRFQAFYQLKDSLEQKGLTLTVTTQAKLGREESDEQAITGLFVEKKIDADFVIATNTGAPLPEQVRKDFSSIGAISIKPILMFAKKGNHGIKTGKDLVGKKILIWTTPEGHDYNKESFMDIQASPYSSDYIVRDLLSKFGITSKNTQITNAWPNPVSMEGDWDVWVTINRPKKHSRSSGQIFEAFEQGKLDLLDLQDIDGIARNLRHLRPLKIPASAYNVANGVPAKDIHALGISREVIVRNDLDTSVILGLAEAIDEVYSEPSELWERNEFPNFSQYSQFSPNAVALKYYKEGLPFLNKYFSSKPTNFIARLAVVMIPLITILYPLFSFLPKIYRFFVDRKLAKYYKDLEDLERKILFENQSDMPRIVEAIDAIENGIMSMKIPLVHESYVQDMFHARGHIQLIKQRLNEKMSVPDA
jgi:hypothetical protein